MSEMSSKFEDSDASLATELQRAAPIGEGPTFGPEPLREPVAPNPLPPAPEAPIGQPGANVPGSPAPEPGAVWCANCRASVEASGRGLCPVCGRFLPANTISLTHGLRSDRLAKKIDAYRVDLIEQLFAERGGRAALSVAGRIAIENYALVCAQHKTIEARLDQDGLFTQTGRRRSAFDMLKTISETIDRLRAALPPIVAPTTTDLTDLTNLTEDGLIAKATVILRDLLAMQDDETTRRLPADQFDSPPIVGGAPAAEPLVKSQPAPDPICEYCHRVCVGPKHHAYDVLHWKDPEEIKRRDAEATAVMMKMMKYGNPY
jgi:hypothetical protein